MRRKLVMIVAALVCGVLGTALLVNFVKGAESRALEGKQLVDVYVARSQIPSGTSVEEMIRLDLIGETQVPAEVRPGSAIVFGRGARPASGSRRTRSSRYRSNSRPSPSRA